MKNILSVIIIGGLFLSSCKKDPATNAQKETANLDYDASYSTWIAYRNSVHNSYVYTTSTSSFTNYATAKRQL